MNVARSINNWLTYRRTVNELGRLNARVLADIGMTPELIPVRVRASIR